MTVRGFVRGRPSADTRPSIRLKTEGIRPSEIASRLGRASVYRVLGEQANGEQQEAA